MTDQSSNSGKRPNKKKWLYVVAPLLAILIVFAVWAVQPENLRGIKDDIRAYLYNKQFGNNSYNAESLAVINLSNDDMFISKKVNEQRLPASLAKLFVVDYALTLVDLDDVVLVDQAALAMTKAGSSVANIQAKDYSVRNLFAAMLVPSGNDAAYAIADYCGGVLSPQADNSQEQVDAFMKKLNEYLQQNGYKDTELHDPSGYDAEARTTVVDIEKVVKKLLTKDWFRSIVSQHSYTATLPDDSTQTWTNTNIFLDPNSDYYNTNVIGVKTGSLSDDYNLVVLYQKHGKEFLICSLGSQSDTSRYDDVNYIIKTIDNSDSLKR